MNKEYQVDAFVFTTKEDADRATKEKKQVEYLKSHLDGIDVEKLKAVYDKANKERMFRTPVGLTFMQDIYTKLVARGVSQDDLLPVFVHATFEQRLKPQSMTDKQKNALKEKQTKLKSNFRFSILLNVVLIVAIIAMFFITINSSNPNILNYETALQDRYSAWEEELSLRENAVREKELELAKLN